MKLVNTIIVSTACLTLAACSVSISDRSHDYADRADYVTVTLPSGELDTLSCPQGTNTFVLNNTDRGKGLVYGCRTHDAPVPIIED